MLVWVEGMCEPAEMAAGRQAVEARAAEVTLWGWGFGGPLGGLWGFRGFLGGFSGLRVEGSKG